MKMEIDTSMLFLKLVEEAEENLRGIRFYSDDDIRSEYAGLVIAYKVANDRNEEIGLITRLRVAIKRFEREIIDRFMDMEDCE